MGGVPDSVSQDMVMSLSLLLQTSWPINIMLLGGGVGMLAVGSSVGRLILGRTPVQLAVISALLFVIYL